MMEAVPKGAFSRDFVLHRHRRPIATLDVSNWRESAEIEIEGVRYRFRRESALKGAFMLEQGEEVLARAVKPSAFKSGFELQVAGRSYTLRRVSAWRRDYGLFVHRQKIGSVSPVAWYTRRSVVRLPEEWSAAVQAFVFWLVLIMWQRAAAAA